jgi:F-type H+-transporting ATPase subunit a
MTLASMASGLPAALIAASAETFDPGAVILHHVADSPTWDLYLSKAVLLMALSALLVTLGVIFAARGYDDFGVPRSRWAQMIDPFIQHFYEDVALQYVGGKWARKVAPLLMTFFFFILTCNLLGLVPVSELIGLGSWLAQGMPEGYHGPFFIEGAATATGNFNVTASLAVITFVAIIIFGVLQHGVAGHFAHLAGPKDAPALVRVLLLIPIETLSMFVKPFALTMRLAANMTAGHMGILALVAIVFILESAAVGIPVVLLATAIMLLEIIVCFVQAYVFALLSGVFIGMAVSSHH